MKATMDSGTVPLRRSFIDNMFGNNVLEVLGDVFRRNHAKTRNKNVTSVEGLFSRAQTTNEGARTFSDNI